MPSGVEEVECDNHHGRNALQPWTFIPYVAGLDFNQCEENAWGQWVYVDKEGELKGTMKDMERLAQLLSWKDLPVLRDSKSIMWTTSGGQTSK